MVVLSQTCEVVFEDEDNHALNKALRSKSKVFNTAGFMRLQHGTPHFSGNPGQPYVHGAPLTGAGNPSCRNPELRTKSPGTDELPMACSKEVPLLLCMSSFLFCLFLFGVGGGSFCFVGFFFFFLRGWGGDR